MRGPPPRHPEQPQEQLPAVEGIIQDAADLKVGDRVVYPNQGVCAVVGFKDMDIGGTKVHFVTVRREEDGALVHVARDKVPSIGLRRVASASQMEGVFHYLAAQFDDPELDWKVRHRDNADRLIAGGVLGVAEVVKGLHSLSRIRPLPTKEREQYDNARHLLVHEIAVSLNVPPVLAEDYVDYALMPPAGVKFDLKPPPKPVLLPSRPKKRPAAVEEDEDDLGLGDLGLDLDLEGALEGAAPAAAVDEGAAAEEGEAVEEKPEAEAAPEGDVEEEHPHAEKAAKAEAHAKPSKAAAHATAPAKKPAAKKAAAPKKPAAPKKAPKHEAHAKAEPHKAEPHGKPAKRGGKKK
ncbi:MAG TPA: CarD family transcriptional regulator [Anaeromyxobacter sp.]|nr:CarD family transcriptional regulator [Anaeromyxobacter sp.]